MILQRIAYPNGATFEEEMYVGRDRSGVSLYSEQNKIVCNKSLSVLKFETYFNTFSIKKWKKYTNIDNVQLSIDIKGKARIVLTTLELHGFDVDEYIVYSEVVESQERSTYKFEYPFSNDVDAFSFQIQPLDEYLTIYEGAYCTNIDESLLRNVDIALGICTYKREEYIKNNMEMLLNSVFNNVDSELYGHLHVYISDNGGTLSDDMFDAKYITLMQNKNSGGSGGFSRAAISAMRDENNLFSHIILMDDDIIFEVDALIRTFTFLRLLRDEYEINMLGGAMFRTDRRFIQHAAGETHTVNGIIFNKAGYNMYNIVDILRNEIEEPINYLGWWYCCIPVKLFSKCQFSLPLFVQYDDIEFSLRNEKVPKITLNGICCWHLPFDKKWSGFKNYYTIRNRAIVNCMYFDSFTKTQFKKELFKECSRKVFQYSYNEANLALLAAEDFLKGMEWLKEQDPAELNKKVIGLSDKLVDIKDLNADFNPREIKYNRFVDERQRHLYWRLFTLNGWLLPAFKTVTVEVDDPRLQYTYRAKKVIKYDINSGKGIVVKKSYKEVFAILARLYRVNKKIDKEFDNVVARYKKMHDEVISETFWKKFLNF